MHTHHKQQSITNIGSDPEKIQVLPIRECGEPLIEVHEEPGIFISPQYHAMGLSSANNQIFVREDVLKSLRIAARALPDGINLLLWDGFRNLETQTELFEKAKLSFLEERRDESVELYLAAPPDSEMALHDSPPPHTTGGAVDLTLCDTLGRPLDMGAEFDEFREIAWLAYFEDDDMSRDGLALQYRTRRRILYWAMMAAGFAPYPWEFWHYELGTIVAANFHGHPVAKYGAALSWSAAK
jgi:D-alanyl-D-alanine dipeptidase